jgi:uncharacterized repeat protein (TIGR03837 family)
VQIRRWSEPFTDTAVADVVIEAFGCELPAAYVQAMAARPTKPGWINLEYLSAEAWVEGSHGRPSPHPRLPLTKHFFFPGFTAQTGGLLRERDLFARRDAFRNDIQAQTALWQPLGVSPPSHAALRVSLFCYDNPAIPDLLDVWSRHATPIACIIPEGPVAQTVAAAFGADEAHRPRTFTRGRLTAHVVPFLAQDRYDELLWLCDVNFVRGEDSFVRAQWAARSFVWHIYPQHDGAHWNKLDSFRERYGTGLPDAASDALRALWTAWNRGAAMQNVWGAFTAQCPVIETHTRRWAEALAAQRDLAARLVDFVNSAV